MGKLQLLDVCCRQSVMPGLDAKFRQGEPIVDGAIVRLFHTQTKKWLHSHLHASPISNNLEVSVQ